MLQIVAAESGSKANFVDFDVPLWVWAAFTALVAVLLLVDLLLVHRTAHVITTREAAIESAVWIAISLLFGLVILAWQGGDAAGEYYAGYLIEKSLSIDNVFVWALIMSYFAVPQAYQFRVLFWGIFGALVLRALFIFGGVALIEQFEWIIYVFGAFLLYTAVKLLRPSHEELHPEDNPLLKLVNRLVPSTTEYDGQNLFTVKNGKRLATPLLAVLIVIESSDVVFAVDSIPAIIAVSHEQFIVFSSNAFAILGLRALYFLLADMRNRFAYLQQGLAVVLAFVGIKMLISNLYHVPTFASLLVIALVLTLAIVASIKKTPDPETEPDSSPGLHD
ncbi:TerC family protein [Actinospongicola halichondriae]|uniref:TerC family protein n=1 Tax=Actinospongicola halichondriae TaxID=3236844 RepID=UPI003D491DC7